MKTVGAYEAKTHLSRLLDEVAEGETITITKHGKAEAQLVPVEHQTAPSRDDAIAAMRAFRKRTGATLGGISIRELIEEGRM